jgi:hypothetical protein
VEEERLMEEGQEGRCRRRKEEEGMREVKGDIWRGEE